MQQEVPCFGSGLPEWQSQCVIEMPTVAAVQVKSAEMAAVSPLDLLSSGERDVVALMREGATNAEIADRLGIDLRTVKDRLCRAFRKLGVRNRINLIVALTFAERPRPAATEPLNLEKAQ